VQDGVAVILRDPYIRPEIEPGVRRYLIDRFPFGLIYRMLSADVVEIIAVMHLHRHQSYWRGRL
jgi:toxin ParE1/3/4